MSSDRKVRQAAFRTLYKAYGQYGNTFSGLLEGFVKEKIALAKVRHFENSLEASVFDDEVPSAIYHNLVQTVRTNLDPLFRYYGLKKRMLGVSSLHLYDIYAPLITSQSRPYPYDEAVELVLKALRPLGKDYVDTLRKGLTKEGWVDVYPSKGKRGGAYSSGCFDSKPYILLNYQERFDDVSTLAHEAGHSMHSYYSRKANLPQNSEYTIFVAEVASTVNELLLSNYMLKNCKDRDMKLNLLDERMNTFKGTLYRQTMFAEYEQIIHRMAEAGEPLTKDALCEAYYELNRRYFGKGVVCDKQIACEWMRIPHFYYNFYVYKYATCISAASAIVKRIETEGESYVKKYLAFLSCGDSRSPLDSLKVAGIDMIRPEVVLAAIDDFADAVDQFEKEAFPV
ncbi:MAG: oligoendopeptidase F, partial [Clostridia bacterium]|nr:oligoendopeptidase F [Clostridia bacterium]